MILTKCAACAAPLPHTSAKQCSRCKTRYCGPACQKQHWDGGHKELCKRIKKGGGAEQYHADKKYKEALALASEKCADDTKGQTCYICTQSVHRHTKEGLVRMCACRGKAGFAHVSCLAEQAKILYAEAEENNLGREATMQRWERWARCSLCEQKYHGVVACALGWACWKTYVGRPETDFARRCSMNVLSSGLEMMGRHEERLHILEAELVTEISLGASESAIMSVRGNMAGCYEQLGRDLEAIAVLREMYEKRHLFRDPEAAFIAAINLADSLWPAGLFDEAKTVLRKTTPDAKARFGDDHDLTLSLRKKYAVCLYRDPGASQADVHEAVAIFEDVHRRARRVFGAGHPDWRGLPMSLESARKKLATFDKDDLEQTRKMLAEAAPFDSDCDIGVD